MNNSRQSEDASSLFASMEKKPETLPDKEITIAGLRMPYFDKSEYFLSHERPKVVPQKLLEIISHSIITGRPLEISGYDRPPDIMEEVMRANSEERKAILRRIEKEKLENPSRRLGDDIESVAHTMGIYTTYIDGAQQPRQRDTLEFLEKAVMSYAERGYDSHSLDDLLNSIRKELTQLGKEKAVIPLSEENRMPTDLELVMRGDQHAKFHKEHLISRQKATGKKHMYIIDGYEHFTAKERMVIEFYCRGEYGTMVHLRQDNPSPACIVRSKTPIFGRGEFLAHTTVDALYAPTKSPAGPQATLPEFARPRPTTLREFKQYPQLHPFLYFLETEEKDKRGERMAITALGSTVLNSFHPELHKTSQEVKILIQKSMRKLIETLPTDETHTVLKKCYEAVLKDGKNVEPAFRTATKAVRKLMATVVGESLQDVAAMTKDQGEQLAKAYLEPSEVSSVVQKLINKISVETFHNKINESIRVLLAIGNYEAAAAAVRGREDNVASQVRGHLADQSYADYIQSSMGADSALVGKHMFDRVVMKIERILREHQDIRHTEKYPIIEALIEERYADSLVRMPDLMEYMTLLLVKMHDYPGADDARQRQILMDLFDRLRDDPKPLAILAKLEGTPQPDPEEKKATYSLRTLAFNTIYKASDDLRTVVEHLLPKEWNEVWPTFLQFEFDKGEVFPGMTKEEIRTFGKFLRAQMDIKALIYYSAVNARDDADTEPLKQKYLTSLEQEDILSLVDPVLEFIDTKRALEDIAPVERVQIAQLLKVKISLALQAFVALCDGGNPKKTPERMKRHVLLKKDPRMTRFLTWSSDPAQQ